MKKRQFVLKPHLAGRWKGMTKFLAEHENETFTATFEPGEPDTRSLTANALQYAWIREIAEWQGESDHNVRLWVKAKIALPVLIQDTKTEDEKDRARRVMKTLNAVGYFGMSDQNKMSVIELIEVTSAMSTRQHNVFRKQMQAHYGNQGLILVVR